VVFKGDYNKYLVLKQEDVEKLPADLKEALKAVQGWIRASRLAEDRKNNTYVVVNEDEPYAEVVWKLIEISQTNPEGLSILLCNLEVELLGFDKN